MLFRAAAMDVRCRLLVLQFVCLVWPLPPHVTVDSFVLRRRSTVDDDPYAVERPALSYLDDVDQYDRLPQYVEDYEMNELPDDDYDDDDAVAEKLMDIIKQERAEQDYEDFGDRDYDDETWTTPLEADREDYDNISDNDADTEDTDDYAAAKVSLDKAQLEKIFTDTNEQPPEHEEIKRTTELSKNDVEKLFDSTAMDGSTQIDADLPEVEPEIEIKLPVESSTDVDEIVKSIEEVKSSDNDDVVGDEVIDVKQESISPDDGTKLTKEWMMELVPTGGDVSSEWSGSSSRKSKRSMDVQSDEDGGFVFAIR